MSRRPDPTALKKAKRNPGRRPLNDDEPPTVGEPVMPKHLSDAAKKLWWSLVPLLKTKGLAGDLDSLAIERLCSCYAEVLAAEAVLNKTGMTYECETENGGTMVRTRPEVAIRADADRRFKGYLVEFGLTPAARSKVKISDQKAKDPRARFFGPKAAG